MLAERRHFPDGRVLGLQGRGTEGLLLARQLGLMGDWWVIGGWGGGEVRKGREGYGKMLS